MCERQPVSRQRRWPDSIAEAKAGENRAFVRMLLAGKQPEFARALADAEAEVSGQLTRARTCGCVQRGRLN